MTLPSSAILTAHSHLKRNNATPGIAVVRVLSIGFARQFQIRPLRSRESAGFCGVPAVAFQLLTCLQFRKLQQLSIARHGCSPFGSALGAWTVTPPRSSITTFPRPFTSDGSGYL